MASSVLQEKERCLLMTGKLYTLLLKLHGPVGSGDSGLTL